MIRVLHGMLTNRVYAAPRVRDMGEGHYVVSGRKDDVTADAIIAVAEHVARCEDTECVCQSGLKRLAIVEKAQAAQQGEQP